MPTGRWRISISLCCLLSPFPLE